MFDIMTIFCLHLLGIDHGRLVAIKSGGQNLGELTLFCRELAKKGITDEFSDNDDAGGNLFCTLNQRKREFLRFIAVFSRWKNRSIGVKFLSAMCFFKNLRKGVSHESAQKWNKTP